MNEKAQAALSKALTGWFSAQFIKGIKLPLLRSIHQAGAYPAFSELLAEATDADRITVLSKVDPHRPEMLMRSKSEVLAHLEQLASDKLQPAVKQSTKKPPAKKEGKGKKQVGIISTSKY